MTTVDELVGLLNQEGQTKDRHKHIVQRATMRPDIQRDESNTV